MIKKWLIHLMHASNCYIEPLQHIVFNETYYVHFQVHNFNFGYHHSKFTCFSLLILSSPVSLRPRLLNTWSPLIDRLTHAWASDTDNNRAAVLNQFLGADLATELIVFKYVTLWCHKVTEVEAGLLMRCFRSSVFRGREELLFCIFNFQDLLHDQNVTH